MSRNSPRQRFMMSPCQRGVRRRSRVGGAEDLLGLGSDLFQSARKMGMDWKQRFVQLATKSPCLVTPPPPALQQTLGHSITEASLMLVLLFICVASISLTAHSRFIPFYSCCIVTSTATMLQFILHSVHLNITVELAAACTRPAFKMFTFCF